MRRMTRHVMQSEDSQRVFAERRRTTNSAKKSADSASRICEAHYRISGGHGSQSAPAARLMIDITSPNGVTWSRRQVGKKAPP